jgi:hypothetical protein
MSDDKVSLPCLIGAIVIFIAFTERQAVRTALRIAP